MNFNKVITLARSTVVSVTVTDTAAVIDSFIRSNLSISGNAVVGLDVQWNSAQTVDARPALLQICYGNYCLIVQLIHVDYFPQSLKNLLLKPNITFVGFGITNDVEMLKKLQLQCFYSVELGPAAYRAYGNLSLARASPVEVAFYVLGIFILKDGFIAPCNWAANVLSEAQIAYAATDAYVSYLLGSELLL